MHISIVCGRGIQGLQSRVRRSAGQCFPTLNFPPQATAEGPFAAIQYYLLWFHHRFVVIAQIGECALIAVWAFKDTDALPMS
jgi:hypothetical protein